MLDPILPGARRSIEVFANFPKLKVSQGRLTWASVKDLSLPEEGEESPDSVGRHTI